MLLSSKTDTRFCLVSLKTWRESLEYIKHTPKKAAFLSPTPACVLDLPEQEGT